MDVIGVPATYYGSNADQRPNSDVPFRKILQHFSVVLPILICAHKASNSIDVNGAATATGTTNGMRK